MKIMQKTVRKTYTFHKCKQLSFDLFLILHSLLVFSKVYCVMPNHRRKHVQVSQVMFSILSLLHMTCFSITFSQNPVCYFLLSNEMKHLEDSNLKDIIEQGFKKFYSSFYSIPNSFTAHIVNITQAEPENKRLGKISFLDTGFRNSFGSFFWSAFLISHVIRVVGQCGRSHGGLNIVIKWDPHERLQRSCCLLSWNLLIL